MSQKEYLLNILRSGVAYSITLKVRNLNMKCYEEIKFYAQDFGYKADYIDSIYEDDLKLKGVPSIQIVGIDIENIEWL